MEQIQCQSWRQESESESTTEHKTMTGKYISRNSKVSYLVESFVLNSVNRVVERRGKGNRPDPRFRQDTQTHQLRLVAKGSGQKVKGIDLERLMRHFEKYVTVVNMMLDRVYASPTRAETIGKALSEYRGRAYTLLRREKDLCYEKNDEFKTLIYERLHRNALEQVGRMVLADYSRRQLFTAAVTVLVKDPDDALSLMRRKRIPGALIRKVRDACDAVKDNGSGFHYAMGVLRQLRYAVDQHVLDTMGIKLQWRGTQRKKIASLLRTSSPDYGQVSGMVLQLLQHWDKKGYPFTTPQLRNYSLDFSASTENSIGQGYWFTVDEDRPKEILLHLKLPPGIDGRDHDASPYKKRTLSFRFLNWLSRAANDDRGMAEKTADLQRKDQLLFRAAKFDDMHHQLINTIQFQHAAHLLARLKARRNRDEEQITELEKQVHILRQSRRSAPPRILVDGRRVTLQIPFMAPDDTLIEEVLGERDYDAKAGVDRGLRSPVAISIERDTKDGREFVDRLIGAARLIQKRELLRKQAYTLISESKRKKNNWDRKRSGQVYPGHILKKDRHIDALWRKVRRLDREVARTVASETVWVCEEHRVRKIFFEDLRSFQAHGGSKDLSYNLSSNLWGKIIDTVRYMREQVGHSPYSVWTVNPWHTSQLCHQCGQKGVRVKDAHATTETRGGEYFYCSGCDEHFHADVNAARNIIHVQDASSSAVAGRTA
ncbi:MAG: hypothetical protein BAJATHORv1_10282 [Candidatus Thorarchaeota archaeon]|nr:MAG: hypothetical protein BAJATHORv1_10282 [Candidatus Thorarchaeota archaeon]